MVAMFGFCVQSGSYSIFKVGEHPYVDVLPFHSYECSPLVQGFHPTYTSLARGVLDRPTQVPVVLRTGGFPEIVDMIVQAVTVDVVKLTQRPFTFADQPNDMVDWPLSAKDTDEPVLLF